MSIFSTLCFTSSYAVVQSLSCVQLFAMPWTTAHGLQAPLPMGFFRQEHWSGLAHPPPGDRPDPGVTPVSLLSPALPGEFFATSTTWEGSKSEQ